MAELDQIAEKLNSIEWRAPTRITPEAEKLIGEHIAKMREVLSYLSRKRGLTPVDAYAEAQSAGHTAPDYKDFMHMLFNRVKFRNAVVREPLILTIASAYFWDQDPELSKLPNPWSPLMKLYEMGYTSSFEEEPHSNGIKVLIGHKSGVEPYNLV